MEKLESLTLSAVAKMANRLIAKYGETTTLEVKKELRQQGYRAFQSEVSDMMDELLWQEMWLFDFNGVYRTYYQPSGFEWAVVMLPRFSEN